MPPKKATAASKAKASAAKSTSADTKKATGESAAKVTKGKGKAEPEPTKATITTDNVPTRKDTTTAPAKAAPAKKATTKTRAEPAKKAAAMTEDSPTTATTTASKKRKTASTDEELSEEEPKEKKQKTTKAAPAAPKVKAMPKAKAPPKPKAAKTVPVKAKDVINQPPTERLNVYVCGEGSSGELGLGNAKNAIDVKRPRLNPNLKPDIVGVTHIAVGGMHAAALTHDNKIYTWGVNDQGALGRDTNWDGGLMDIDEANEEDDEDGDKTSETEDSEDDSGLNPLEAMPTAIPDNSFPAGTVFVELAAGDSNTFALTDEGLVYGWGTFRSNEGILGFSLETGIQRIPILVEGLKKIQHIVCGENHVLALDHKGAVFAWGSGQQNQLGRRIIERTRMNALTPREFGLPKGIKHVGCGAYHSFAVGKDNKVYAWGLNNYGETGVEAETRRQVRANDETVIFKPEIIKGLAGKEIVCIHGGAHHSIAVTKAGECLVWGRIDGFQMGMKTESLPQESVIDDEKKAPRILARPTAIPNLDAVYATAGSDHCIAVTPDGKAYSWGFSANYQTGLGTDEDVEVATMIDNTAVRDRKLNWAGAGGQFSVFTSIAE